MKELRTYVLGSAIDKKIDVYARKLLSLKTLRAIKNNWDKQFKSICLHFLHESIGTAKDGFFEFEKGKYAKMYTITKVITALRAKIKEASKSESVDQKVIDWLLKDGVKISKSEFRGVVNMPKKIEQKREVLTKKRFNEKRRNTLKIHDLQHVYDTCLEFLDNPAWYKKVIALSFFTGRRLSEIIQSGKITYTSANGVLNFRGQLKTHTNIGYNIPVLHQKQVMACWKSLRRLRPDFVGMHIDRASNSATTSVNRHVKKVFGQDMTMHKLRSIYGLLMHHYCNTEGVPMMTFVGDILGHTSGNQGNSAAETTERYDFIEINFNLNPEIVQQLASIEYIYREVE